MYEVVDRLGYIDHIIRYMVERKSNNDLLMETKEMADCDEKTEFDEKMECQDNSDILNEVFHETDYKFIVYNKK